MILTPNFFRKEISNPDRKELTGQIVSKEYTEGYKCRM